MCNLRYLSSYEGNYIALCEDCSYYQICFENLLFSLKKEDCAAMHGVLKSIVKREGEYMDVSLRRFIISTPMPTMSLFLCMQDVRILDEMMENAENEAIALSLMNLLK